ncbi:MAG: hypothetical protein AB4290_25855 [Spirulina sp.]
MDKLVEYPQLIKRILTGYIELCDRALSKRDTIKMLQSPIYQKT